MFSVEKSNGYKKILGKKNCWSKRKFNKKISIEKKKLGVKNFSEKILLKTIFREKKISVNLYPFCENKPGCAISSGRTMRMIQQIY